MIDMAQIDWRSWLVDVVGGGLVGGIVGAIVAFNIAIFLGVPSGYQASIGEVFAHNVVVGILWLAALISGPVVGVVVARRQRNRRELSDKSPVGTH